MGKRKFSTSDEKVSERIRNYVLNYEFPFLIVQYLDGLTDLVALANTSYGYALQPEALYSDRYGKVCHSWLIDEVRAIFDN